MDVLTLGEACGTGQSGRAGGGTGVLTKDAGPQIFSSRFFTPVSGFYALVSRIGTGKQN